MQARDFNGMPKGIYGLYKGYIITEVINHRVYNLVGQLVTTTMEDSEEITLVCSVSTVLEQDLFGRYTVEFKGVVVIGFMNGLVILANGTWVIDDGTFCTLS